MSQHTTSRPASQPVTVYAVRDLIQLHWKPLLAAGIVFLLLALGTMFHQPFTNQLNAWKFLPQPERLTELYYTHPSVLPSTYTPGKTQTVSFTVHNLEYQTTTYQYKVIEQSQDGTQSKDLTTGQFAIGQDQFQNTSVPVSLPDLGSRTKLVIQLSPVNETIAYWVNRSSNE